MKMLVTGYRGQVASALRQLARKNLTIVALGRPHLDILEPSSIGRAINDHEPDVVVNTAAYTAVDEAEREPRLAFAVNRDGARNAAAAAHAGGRPIIHLSTDHVFDGNLGRPYRESDAASPLNTYGASKLAGELAVAGANPDHVILRCAWIFSGSGTNFLKTMLRLAGERSTIPVVADQVGSPTFAEETAKAVVAVAGHIVAKPRERGWRGTFHAVAPHYATRAAFAEEILGCAAAKGGPVAEIRRIATADYPTPARRPRNGCLDPTRFEETFGYRLDHFHAGVTKTVRHLMDARRERP